MTLREVKGQLEFAQKRGGVVGIYIYIWRAFTRGQRTF